jgi:hypothetical protein
VNTSRRDFILAGCVIGAAALVPNKADALFHGDAGASLNNNRVTINVPSVRSGLYLNMAKGFPWPPLDPTTTSSDGYPTSTPSSTIGCNPFLDQTYFGNYVWKWSGSASMELLSGGPMIVVTGGAFMGLGTNSGDFNTGANVAIVSQTNPRVVFAFGFYIQSISQGASNDLGGNLIRIGLKKNYANGANFTGTTFNVAGANSNTGANGNWVVNQVDNQTFDLEGSSYTNPQASAAGTITYGVGGLALQMLATGTYSGFSNLVWCRAGDETAVANGQIIDNDIISQLQYLMNGGTSLASRGWARFMDLTGVQGSFECDFSQRIPATALCYQSAFGNYRPGYWAGTITNGGSDNYTCSDPSVSTWNGSAYIDNAIVIGRPSATNSGGSPTLAVGGHPAKPILYWNDGIPPFILALSGPPPNPGTDVLQFTFQASWLNSNTPYVFTYPTVSGDYSQGTFNANLANALQADTTLASNKIFILNPGNGIVGYGPFIQPRTPHAGALTVTYSSGPAVCSVQNMRKSVIDNTAGGTFIYNYLLDAWIYMDGGMICCIPLEAIVEFCNRAGTHCWFNIGTTKGAWITAVTQFFADPTSGLTSGLRFGTETYNEVWNSGASPFSKIQSIGSTLGWSFSSDNPNYSYTALRTIQYSALAKAAWTGKGRSASDYYVLMMSAEFDTTVGNAFDTHQLQGVTLNTTNFPIYATYGGLNGGGSSPDYSTAGSRPVDITTCIGLAPYWGSPWWNTTAGDINGTVAVNSAWLQASLDYANGNIATAFTNLANQFNGTTTRSSGGANAISLANYLIVFQQEEALAASYDSYRVSNGIPKLGIMHYEGGSQWAVGNNGVNGTNSATDTGPLIAQLNSIWSAQSVAAYTVSGTDNKKELANQVLALIQGWKYDTDHNGNPASTGSYKSLVETSYYRALKTTSGANRETKPAQYGYQATTWGYFPVTLLANNAYQSYVAAHEWNAGS